MSSRSRDIIAHTLAAAGVYPAEMYCVAQSGTAPFAYWKDWFDADKWGSDIATVFDLTTEGRNDTILLMPGRYIQTASIDWDKDNVHLVGLGGSNHPFDYGHTEACIIYATTASAIAQVLHVTSTAKNCQFHNIMVQNNSANAGSLCALKVDAGMATFKGCSFAGIMNSTQMAVAAASSVYIHSNAGGYKFEDCIIGDDLWQTRTTAYQANGVRFTATGWPRPYNGIFKRCWFRSNATGEHCGSVGWGATNSSQWFHVFDNCLFTNFVEFATTQPLAVFTLPANPRTTFVVLRNGTTEVGWQEWQIDNYELMFNSDMPDAHASGGIVCEPTG